jgi:4-hydroxyphenylpyruvate dioxygenase
MSAISEKNPCGVLGIEFVEFSSLKPSYLDQLFREFGFSKTMKATNRNIDLYQQNDINFMLNNEPNGFAMQFAKDHGPAISAMGWRVENAAEAFASAVKRGAKPFFEGEYLSANGQKMPAIYGIGNSLIYFVDQFADLKKYEKMGFVKHPEQALIEEKGFLTIDHLTNNVPNGTMATWAKFYKEIFGFTEVRYFDIRGAKTGLQSYALRSPDGSFCIPINEGTEAKSQINEYLREYNGAGIQHLAFLTKDILTSLKKLDGTNIDTLDIDDEYYAEVFNRVPNVKEDKKLIRDYDVLVDGDEEGYLLQIFTKNIIGPIFIEIIQRENHLSFGEGNFGALFRSIERDQEKRGVL